MDRAALAERIAEHERETALALAIALAGAWLAYALLSVFAAAWPAVIVEVSAGLGVLGIWRWADRARASEKVVAHSLSGLSAIALFVLAMASGQGDSQAFWQLVLVPLIAATVLGRSGALVWALACGLLIALVHASEVIVRLPLVYAPEPWMRSVGGVTLTAIMLGYVMYTRGVARRHLREAIDHAAVIAAQSDAQRRAQEELERARAEALGALQHKNEFLATLSHELRAPLNGLLGLSSVLLESRMTSEQRELVRTLHQSASSMRKILNDVLDVSRIESGRLELREESVDVRELIGEVLDVFAPAAADKGVELAAVVAPEVPASMRLDPVRFGQVLTNLVNNALKFTPSGEIVVEVCQVGARSRLTVRDTGVGIAEAERDRLFRPFEQTASGQRSLEIGSGLGLWISQRIVAAMKGAIGLGEVEQGSEFFVEWEAERGSSTLRESVEIPGGISILAVEDHEASARALAAIAHSLHLRVVIARSIDEASRVAEREGELHAVLIDATLPGLTPEAAAEALRALPSLRRLPFVSAVAPSAERVRVGVRAPFVATTLKPYRASRLVALLSDVLSSRAAAPTPASLAPWRPLDVLVVDDDSTNRLVAKLLLERAGLRPHQAASGEEALAALASRHVDVVLLDLHMSGIDGLETARRIRAELDPSRRLWIVALTASIYDEDRQRCLDAGMDDFVPKPIEIGLFRAALERAQRGSRRRSTSATMPPPSDAGVSARVVAELVRALGETSELALLVDDWTESGGALLDGLRVAVEHGDVRGAERGVHTLASSAGQLGAQRLERLSRELERAARSGTLPERAQIEELAAEHASAVAELRRILSELSE